MAERLRFIAVILACSMIGSAMAAMVSPADNLLYCPGEMTVGAETPDAAVSESDIGQSLKREVIQSAESPSVLSQPMDSVDSVAGLGNWSFRDAHDIGEAEELGYNGSGIVVGIADSGVDFCKSELQDALMVGPDGWPAVMDIASLREYLGRGIVTEDSWFADTSFNASADGSVLPSFEYFHSPYFTMNGKADDFNSVDKNFLDTKEVTAEGSFWDGESWLSLDMIGGKDFDLQNLYVSRDKDNWYLGFNTRNAQVNRSYGMYLDFDSTAGGASIGPAGVPDPRGNFVNAETAHTGKVNSVAYHPDVHGQALLASCSDGIMGGIDRESILIWDDDGNLIRSLQDPSVEIDEFKSVEWTPSGDRLVASTRFYVFSWDTATWALVGSRSITAAGIYDCISVNPNGTWAAAANGSRVTLVRPGDMSLINTPSVGGGTVQNVAFSPVSGDRLAVGLNDGYVRIFNSADLTQPAPAYLREFAPSFTGNGHEPGWPVKSLAWSPDGAYLATGGDDGRVFIWNVGTGNIAAAWNGTLGHPLLSSPGSYAISGMTWADDQLAVTAGNGNLTIIDTSDFSVKSNLQNRNGVPLSCSGQAGSSGSVFVGTENAAVYLVDTETSTPAELDYTPWVRYRPDVVVYADYVAERYEVDENGVKVIGTPDRVEDPQVYRWDSGAWNVSFLSEHGEGLHFYKGNKDISSESEGITELTALGFIEIAVPRSLTDGFGKNSLSVKLFVTGEMPSTAQDSVPTDYNIKSATADFTTQNATALSSFGYVQFPETSISLTGIESKSGVYHYGFHPSDSLRNLIQKAGPGGNDYVGILVVDANTAGVYDTVVIDLNDPADPGMKTPLPNYMFDDDDPAVTKDNPFVTLDMLNTLNQKIPDGTMDYSAGLVYHISNGDPLPYSERLSDAEVMKFNADHPMPVPGAGEIVCFFGEFETYLDGGVETARKTGTVAASAIASRSAVEDPEGFGIIAGAATGAKLMAVGRADKYFQSSIRFLVEGPDGLPETGDECSIVYVGTVTSSYIGGLDSQSHFLDYMAIDYLGGNVTFVLPAGNDGPGMGTIASPTPRNALIVGASMDNAYSANAVPEHLYGDIAQWSSRGPTAAGYPKPDIVASGVGRFSEPLVGLNTAGGSAMNVRTFRDSRIAASVSAGVAAQVQQAFFEAHGRLPDLYETVGILKASAKDMGYDVLAQGSGLLNALDAVRMASGEAGIMIDGIDIVPSNYWSTDYGAFPRVMEEGTAAEAGMGIRNTGPATDVDYAAERHVPVWEYTAEFPATKTVLMNLTDLMPLNITYLKVTAMADASVFFKDTMEPYISVNNALIAADWSDDAAPFPDYGDMNILCQAEQDNSEKVLTNVIELEVGQPHRQFCSNIWFALGAENLCGWSVTVTGYVPGQWDWISLGQAPASLSAAEEANLTLTASVPEGTLPGTYSGSVRVMSDPTDVSNEVLYTPPPGSLAAVAYEEVGITVGSAVGTLANGNVVEGTLALVRNEESSGAWVSYRDGPGPADNNAVAILAGAENIPWSIPIPVPPGVPLGTPISDILMSWAGDDYGTPGDLSDDWWMSLYDSGYNEGSDYTVDPFVGGNITFLGNNWNGDWTVGWPGCEFYINYTYQSQSATPLASPADYTVNTQAGVITFTSPIGTGTVNITANYTHTVGEFRRLCLQNSRIIGDVVLTRFNTVTGATSAVPAGEYEFSPLNGIVMFNDPQSSIYAVNASYSYHASAAVIPVAVNVGASRIPSYSLGGDPNRWINSPTTVNGGYNYALNSMSGDRRYFYFSVPSDGRFVSTDNFRSLFNLIWGDVPTDIDTYIYSVDDSFIPMSDRVGPYIMKEIGKGPVSTVPAGFTTTSGGSNETISFPFTPGLNVICLRAKLLAGVEQHSFSGTGGYLTYSSADERVRNTNELGGSLPLEVMSNIDMDSGFFASVLGPAIGKTYTAEEITQDDIFYDITQEDWWRINSGAKYSKLIDVPEGSLSLDVHIIGYDNCPDLDLCLFYDGKNGQEDGVAQWDEFIDRTVCEDIDNYGWGGVGTNFKTYAYSAGAGSDEATKVLKPKPGTWIVKVVGYEVTGNPGNFDLIVKTIKDGVKGYEMSSQLSNDETSENALAHHSPIERFSTVEFSVDWNFPARTAEDGAYSGVVTVGNFHSRDVMSLPIEIILDREAPEFTGAYPPPNAHVRDPMGMVFCSFSDQKLGLLDGSTVRFSIDGRDLTGESVISVPRTRASLNDPFGYWGGSVLWNPKTALSEGGHVANLVAGDTSDNLLNYTWGFTVDSHAPVLTVDAGKSEEIRVNSADVTLSGRYEAGTSLTSFSSGQHTLTAHPDGMFSVQMHLADEETSLILSCTDAAGNSAVLTRQVILDRIAPGFTRLFSSQGSVTSSGFTNVYGVADEPGTLIINGETAVINSDGSFNMKVALSEGDNLISLELTDLAGNIAQGNLTVTRDTVAPSVTLAGIPQTVNSRQLNITGRTEQGCTVRVNGKPVSVTGTRQEAANFAHTVILSPSINTVVVESTDQAGNTAQETFTVEYLPSDGSGVNYAAIGLMVALLIVGLILGIMLGPMLLGGRKDEPSEEMPPEGEMPEGDTPEIEAVPEDVPSDAEMPEEPTEPEAPREEAASDPIPVEESIPAEQPESEVLPDEQKAEPEDPRIAKLREAFESGKITRELYEKNLQKFGKK